MHIYRGSIPQPQSPDVYRSACIKEFELIFEQGGKAGAKATRGLSREQPMLPEKSKMS